MLQCSCCVDDYWKNHSYDYTDLCWQRLHFYFTLICKSKLSQIPVFWSRCSKRHCFLFVSAIFFFQSWVYLQILKHLTSFWFLISELQLLSLPKGFPDGSVGKESACNSGDTSLIPVSGRSSGEGIGYPLQYSWASLAAQMVKNPPAMRETWVWSLGWEDPLEKGTATHSTILAWRIPLTIVLGVTKRWTGQSNFHFLSFPSLAIQSRLFNFHFLFFMNTVKPLWNKRTCMFQWLEV